MKIAPPFGIDLGTTRTAAAAFLPGASEPTVATDDDGHLTTPSIIGAAGKGRWKVGRAALDDSGDDSSPPVESVKRLMGTSEPVRHADGLRPEEVSAIIVSSIADRMRRHLANLYPDLDMAPRDAVITVPAYFDAPQIEATRSAGEQAGLRIAGLVQEPTAAAIYHTWNQDIGDGTFLVYDLGGGTFDVSIIRAIYGEYQVLAIDGDNHLGGDDFDRRLAEYFRSRLADQGYVLGDDLDAETDRRAFEILQGIARQTKEALSDDDSVTVDESQLFEDRNQQSVDLQLEVERSTFNTEIIDLVDATIMSCRRAIETAGVRHDIEPSNIDGIFLVGGSTRVPAVRQRITDTIGADLGLDDEQILFDEPETSVARGAALHAAAVAPLRFESQDSSTTIAITDQPSDNPDRRLIGHVEYDGDQPPTEIAFGVTDDDPSAHIRKTSLEQPGESPRFSIVDFDAHKLAPLDIPLVSTTLQRGSDRLFGPDSIWLPDRPEDARPAPTLALTNPAVLAKDINIEVVDDGKASRYTLIESGTHLPTTARRDFVTGDRSGAVVLRLFQHRLPIHTLALTLPDDTAPGTPVELTVDVDQAMNITASGKVVDQTFWARIDRPQAPRHRDWDEIEEMLDSTDAIAQKLWGVEARRFRRQVDNLSSGIQAAVRHDPRRLQVLARRLESLLDDYAPRPKRTPGKRRIDQLIDTIRRLVFAADDDRLGRSNDEWRRVLDEMSNDVEQAWRSDDDLQWKTVADRVQATYESVAQDEFMFRRRDPQSYAQTLLSTTASRLQELYDAARNFPLADDEDARKLQGDELRRIKESLDDLQRRFPSPPPAADDVSTLKRLARSVTHLEGRLDRVHTLGVPRTGDEL